MASDWLRHSCQIQGIPKKTMMVKISSCLEVALLYHFRLATSNAFFYYGRDTFIIFSIFFMKKLLIGLMASMVFFSGCTLFGEKDGSMSLDDARKMAQENPSELFYALNKANSEDAVHSLKKYIPSMETLQRYQSEYNETVSFDLANTPLGGGKGTYTFSGKSEGDYRDLQNPKQKTDFAIVADIMGGMMTADVKATMMVVEKSLFVSFEKMNINMMMMPPAIKTALTSLAGKAYGNSFEEIKTLTEGELNIGKYFMSGGILLSTSVMMEEMTKNPKDYMTFSKFLKEENGYFYFEVTPNPVGQEKTMQWIMNIMPFGKSFEEEMKASMEEAKAMANQPIVIAYTPAHKEYFIQEIISPLNPQVKTVIKKIENEVSLSFPINDTQVITAQNIGKDVMVTKTEGDKTATLAKGVYDKKTMSIDIYNPEDNTVVAHITGENDKSGWKGEITSALLETVDPTMKGAKILFSNASASPEKYSLSLDAQLNNASIAKADWSYTIKKASGDLNIAKPSNAEPFANIAAVVNAINQAPVQTDEDTAKMLDDEDLVNMSDEELDALEKELMKTE